MNATSMNHSHGLEQGMEKTARRFFVESPINFLTAIICCLKNTGAENFVPCPM